MGVEIERKFLVVTDAWRDQVVTSTPYRQGYIVSDETRSVRVRIAGDRAWLNIKTATVGVSRQEWEYAIPAAEGAELMAAVCRPPVLEKTRHLIPAGALTWEVDEFSGANAPLVLAEIELPSADAPFDRPPWLGREVTEDIRYYSARLAVHPYRDWANEA